MTLQEFVFRAPGKAQKDVFIVREGDRFGLITMPIEGDNPPSSLTEDELRAKGGSFITLPQWDEIRTNVCFNPDDDDQKEVNDPKRITCNYYVLKDGCWGVLDETGCLIQKPQY